MLLVVVAVMAHSATMALATPGAISGLTAPSYSTGSFTFTWNPVAGIAGYAYSFDQNPSGAAGTTVALSPLGFASTQVTVGSGPHQVVSGDFGNGQLDLAVLNENANSISILLGNGHGVFTTVNTYATGADPHSIVVGDFNGDGRPDLAVANWGANTVSVLLGVGTGTFAAKVDYPTGSNPHGLAVGDLGNGQLDLVVANASDNTISVLLGKGDGSFAPRVNYPAGAHPEKIAIADFNGDGRPDLAVINNVGNTVNIFLGNGDGSFTAGNTYATGKTPYWLAVGDLGNGQLDLVTANWADNTVSVLLGNGDGSFAPRVNYAVGSKPICVAIADINGDGIPDLVVSDHIGSNLAVLLGRGDTSFTAAQFVATSASPRFFAVGDFNGDGSSDLAVPFDSSNKVAIMLNTTNSATPQVSLSATADGVWYFHVCAIDVNGNPGPTSTRQVIVDTTPPVTTDDANPGGVPTWHAGPWTMTLSPTDPPAGDGSDSGMTGGQATTEYSLDNQVTWQSGTTVSFPRWKRGGGSGIFTVFYRSTDAAGNTEKIESTTVRIDNSLPTSSAALTTPGDPTTVTLTATDPDSGVNCIWYSLDGGAWTQVSYPSSGGVPVSIAGAGDHTLCYYSVDNAGNAQAGYNVATVTVTAGAGKPGSQLAGQHGQPHRATRVGRRRRAALRLVRPARA